jgi:hypothetical protein
MSFYCCVSQIKNFLLEEPLLDYLNLYGDKSKQTKPTFEECDFSTFIMDMGNKWEEYVVNVIIEKCKLNNISYTSVERKSGYHQTKNALSNKTDVIFQAQVKDWNNNITGYPDIILKKSAFLKLFKFIGNQLDNIPDDEYIVIDIKFSSVKWDENSYVIETSNYIKFIKGQISMYSRLLKSSSPVGFIISKDISTLECPIALNVKDKVLNKECDNAIEWLKLLHKKEFDVFTLKPNMNNTMDGYWREYKKELTATLESDPFSEGKQDDLAPSTPKTNVAYISTVVCNKFDLHSPVKQYTVAVMVKLNNEIHFNITYGFTDENLLEQYDHSNYTIVSNRKLDFPSHIVSIDPPRKGTIKSELEITAVYNRDKLSEEIIRGIIDYCLEDCNELEKRYNLI